MAAFDLLEFVSCGPIGVLIVIIGFSLANYFWRLTIYGVYLSASIVFVVFITHLWRLSGPHGTLERLAPPAIVQELMKGTRRRAILRERRERASYRRLYDEDLGVDFQAADLYTETSTAPSPNPKSTAATISAGLRASEQRSDSLRKTL